MRKEEVISRYRGLLCYVIRPIVGDENLVEDCLSTVQETILQNFDSFDPKKGSLTGWLTKVAHNGALNFVRSRDNQMLSGRGRLCFAGCTDAGFRQQAEDGEGDVVEEEKRMLSIGGGEDSWGRTATETDLIDCGVALILLIGFIITKRFWRDEKQNATTADE